VADQVIHLTALVSVQPARAFDYFTKAALLTEWLTSAAEILPEVGGRFELFWEPGDRENNSTIGCEDLIGAGAIIAEMGGSRSPEACAASWAFECAVRTLLRMIESCALGKELMARGHGEDVAMACDLNADQMAPRLVDEAYTAA
jgi:hypothetical protein